MPPSPTRFSCPSCGATVKVPGPLLGRSVACPKCKIKFVPSHPVAAPAPAPNHPRNWVREIVVGVIVAVISTGLLGLLGRLSLDRGKDTPTPPQEARGQGSEKTMPGGKTEAPEQTKPIGKTEPVPPSGKEQPGKEPPPPKGEPPRAGAPFDEAKAKELQRAWAEYLGRPVEETLDLGNGEKLVVVLIPPGTFRMGAPEGEQDASSDEKPHRVTLLRPFYLGKFHVTQGQYEAVIGKNPSYYSPSGPGAAKVKGMPTFRFPVEQVSWDDADKFCTLLGKKVGRAVTLPTEAEWEYACRAGTETPFHFGKVLNGKQANIDGNFPYGTGQKGPFLGRPTEVGSNNYPPNAWGLYDMHGNVYQWCRDWYGPYDDLNTTDPERMNKVSQDARVLRGGSCFYVAGRCRAAHRDSSAPSNSTDHFGFRVAVRLD
jgi:formylglycine-generating enzyme required for sulfatase activity